MLGLCFGVSLLAAKLGYSVALGAFVIGAVIAEAREIHRIEALLEPVRDMFSAIFFVAIGLLIDPRMLIDYWQPVAGHHPGGGGRQGAHLLGRRLRRRPRHAAPRCASAWAWRRSASSRSSSPSLGVTPQGDQRFPLSDRGGGVRHHHAAHALPDPRLRPAGRLARKHLPAWLRRSLGLYTEWLQSIQPTGQTAALAAIVWRILAHVAVNMMLIAAIFFGMAYFSDHVTGLLGTGALAPRFQRAILWAGALALSLPFLIATYRKLKALGMLLAGLGVPEARAGRHTPRVRAVLAEVFPVLSLLLMFLLISALKLQPAAAGGATRGRRRRRRPARRTPLAPHGRPARKIADRPARRPQPARGRARSPDPAVS
ncbi:MAG: cation:proton antiporter [Chromatiales bacterium]|nr:cation:proton antiporter [Chromatiales bacterium]